MPASESPSPSAAAAAPDASDTRGRLLACALRLFSERGFARTSTRALAEAACANLAAIRYYFGDKAGLYRATFAELASSCGATLSSAASQTLPSVLREYFGSFVEPLKQGERMQQMMRLHIREMLEPTEQSQTERARDAAVHAALVAALCRELALAEADDEVHRLALAITGLGIQLIVARDMVETERPTLFAAPGSLDAWAARLVDYALTLVEAERLRRGAIRTVISV